MKQGTKNILWVVVAICLILQGTLQRTAIYGFWRNNYSTDDISVAEGLSPDQLLVALAGFREMIAGIVWVRADSFFETGNYDAIVPIIFIVTRLDPKQIDVYATGMWHIGYNFTDEGHRSDRRYIPVALALGREGSKKNSDTYELFFETGWMWYHKIDDDYDKAVDWFRQAIEREDMLEARKNLLGMAYQRAGRVDEGLDWYMTLFNAAQARWEEDEAFGNFQQKETLENNIDTTLVRMAQRGWFARNANLGPGAVPYDTEPPFNVGFSVRATVEKPRVITFQGTWNVLPVGTRIRCILRDADFPNAAPGGMDWEAGGEINLNIPRDSTFMQEQLFVRNRRFRKEVDMSKDPTMYPFTSDRYVLEFYYNPRSAPPHIQDRFGWNGEGMTDANFLNEEIREGQRVVFATLELTREQILRLGEWRDRVPFAQTSNYKPPTSADVEGELIEVPGLLSEPGTTVFPGKPSTPTMDPSGL